MPPKGTLKPCIGEGINEDTTENIFIEGENLEVLKILRKSYRGKIKIICIDPPYNTGNDFIYKDDFSEPLEDYLRKSGQKSEEGLLTSNPKSQGRFHSNWLNFMYPRLRVAKDLLTDDGVIFVFIDDNEVSNLNEILNEIFGEEHFLAKIIWKHTQQSKNDEKYFSRHHNSILVYRKTDLLDNFRTPRSDEDNKNYSNPDNDPNGPWRSGDVRSPNYRKTLCYDITTPSGKTIAPPEKGWRWSKDEVISKIQTGEIIFNKDETKIIRKIYLNNQDGRMPENVWIGDNFGTTRTANAMIKELFDGNAVFDTPKPVELYQRIMDLFINNRNDYFIMDFFAGSGTIGHATYLQNLNDLGTRKYIAIQLPEFVNEKSEAFKLNYKSISELSKERIKRAIKQLIGENNSKLNFNQNTFDLGFKVYRLDRSNIREWQDVKPVTERANTLFSALENQANEPIHKNSTTEDLITEFILVEGFPLHAKVSKIEELKTNTVFKIQCSEIPYNLFICLDDLIKSETISNLKIQSKDTFISLDRSFNGNDEIKMQLDDICKLKTV